jgi:FixJ family two-component response regulator
LPSSGIISVVDDDEAVCLAVTGLLRSFGFAAHGFTSAEAFLRSPRSRDSDCLIADVQMPGMGGLELQNALAERASRIPMIFMTAFPEQRIRERTVSAGAIAFLEKPCDAETILQYIEAALRKSG